MKTTRSTRRAVCAWAADCSTVGMKIDLNQDLRTTFSFDLRLLVSIVLSSARKCGRVSYAAYGTSEGLVGVV
jgi:hypothetical protein